MNNLLSNQSWAEFFLQAFMSHWFLAIALVLLVGAFVATKKSLNATTRHNIWLITLISFFLMPLLVFLPKPNVDLPSFRVVQNLGQTPNDTQIVMPTTIRVENTPQVAQQNTTTINQNPSPVISTSKDISRVTNTASAATSPVPVTKQISLTSLLKGVLIFWLLGAVFLVRRLWGEYRAARELELQSDSVTPYFEQRFKQLCERLDIKEKPLIRFHAGINAPMTVGLYRVWVAIPMIWREEIDDDVFDQTLTHELGHISRKDPLVHTVQRLMNILFWMYPAVWYVSRQLELERESACDDWVLTHDGKGHTYANNLLNVAESLYLQPNVLAVGCLRSHSQLSRRIQNLLNKSSDHAIRNSRKLLVGVTTALFLTLSVSAVMWPDANEYLANQAVEQSSPTGEVGFLEDDSENKMSGGMLVLNGVEIDSSTSLPVHNPVPASPESPKIVNNKGGGTHDYFYSESGKHSELIQNNSYGKGSLSIEREDGEIKDIIVKPVISKSKQPLLYAAWNNDLVGMKRLVEKGKNVNTVYERPTLPRTALDAAILKADLSMLKYLIANHADVNRGDNSLHDEHGQMNALTTAAMAGNVEIAKYLMKKGADPDDATMIVAVQSKNTKLVEYFIDQEFELEDTLLIIAVQNRDQEMIDVLLDNDVDIDDGALIVAVQNRDKATVKRLLKAGADIDDGALVIAIQNRDEEMVDWLLDAGAEPDDGALVIAVQNRNKPLVKRLLKAGADIDDGALIIAIQNRDEEMVDWLLDAGAEPDDGALVIAIQNNNKKLVKRLIEVGADIDDGSLIIAIQSQDVDIVRWLLKAGAPVDDGAMIIAIQSGNKEIIELIQSEYQSEVHSSKEYDFNSLDSMQALESMKGLEALEGQEEFEVIAEKYGEEFGEYVAEGVVNFIGDVASGGFDLDSLAILKAMENEDIKLAKELLEDGVRPNTLLLIKALEQDETGLARAFLKAGAKPNSLTLLQALENEQFQLAKEFMQNGAAPNGIVLLKVLETDNKEMIELVREYMKDADESDYLDNQAFLNENKQQNQHLSQSLNLNLRENLLKNISYNTPNFTPAANELEDCPEDAENSKEHKQAFVLTELPVAHGRITQSFDVQVDGTESESKAHRGVDIAASQGTKIKAVAAGVVIKSVYHKTFGNVVKVDHGNGYISLYAHNQKNLVKFGDVIRKGDVIALVGNTGKSSGPHVHFDISHNGTYVNPIDFLVEKRDPKIRT